VGTSGQLVGSPEHQRRPTKHRHHPSAPKPTGQPGAAAAATARPETPATAQGDPLICDAHAQQQGGPPPTPIALGWHRSQENQARPKRAQQEPALSEMPAPRREEQVRIRGFPGVSRLGPWPKWRARTRRSPPKSPPRSPKPFNAPATLGPPKASSRKTGSWVRRG